MTNELVVRNMDLSFDELARSAQAMAQSGFFKDARDVSQAMVKVLAGAEIGLGPFAAMTGIHIIQGKPVMGANLIATLIKNDPRYDYHVERLDDKACEIAFYEGGEMIGASGFSMDDARDANLLSNPTWKKYPRNMLFARAISNGARWYTPGIFGGAAVYTPDELGADVDEEGFTVIDVTPEPEPSPLKAEVVHQGNGQEPSEPEPVKLEDKPRPNWNEGVSDPRDPGDEQDDEMWAKALRTRSLTGFANAVSEMTGHESSKVVQFLVASFSDTDKWPYDSEHNEAYLNAAIDGMTEAA